MFIVPRGTFEDFCPPPVSKRAQAYRSLLQPVPKDADADLTDAPEEDGSIDDAERFLTETGSLLEGEGNFYVMPEAFDEIPVFASQACQRKRYAFFDRPLEMRSCSQLIADLQETALPLEKPLQYEKTRLISGKIEGKTVVLETDLNDRGERVEAKRYRTLMFDGEPCFVHRDVVTWMPEAEDLMVYSHIDANGHC